MQAVVCICNVTASGTLERVKRVKRVREKPTGKDVIQPQLNSASLCESIIIIMCGGRLRTGSPCEIEIEMEMEIEIEFNITLKRRCKHHNPTSRFTAGTPDIDDRIFSPQST